MGRKQLFKAEEVINAIRGRPGVVSREGKPEGSSMGIKSVIAQRLGCSRDTVDRYIDRYVTVKAAFKEERERLVDVAEVKLLDRVNASEWPAIKYVLSTLGKDRGYTERQEITGAEGGPIKHEDVGLTDAQRAKNIATILDAARERVAGQDSDE